MAEPRRSPKTDPRNPKDPVRPRRRLLLDIVILRRIAYNAMALFRARTLRADANRLMPWRELTRLVYAAIMTATEEAVNSLRARAPP